MAGQSDIQSLLQDLTGVQTQGQAWVPSSVNNGNPNTAYNNSPATVIPFHNPVYSHNPSTAQGYIPPQTNAQGDWQTNMPYTPASTNWKQMSAANQGVGMPAGFAGWGDLKGTGVGWAPGTAGVNTPPPALPPGTPGTGTPGGVNTGGNLPPQVKPGGKIGNYDGGDLSKGRGLDLFDLPPGDIGFYDKPTGGSNQLSGTLNDSAGWGGMSANDIQGTLGTSLNFGSAGQSFANTSLGRAFGFKQDGSIAIGQILDLLVPGNVYMSQTGKLNLLNAIPGLLSRVNPALGIVAANVMKWLAQHTKIQALKNWLQRNIDNKNAGRGGGGGDRAGAGYGDHTGGSGFMGGSWGWTGGTGLGSVSVGGTGPGEISGVSGFNGSFGNPMSQIAFHPSDVK